MPAAHLKVVQDYVRQQEHPKGPQYTIPISPTMQCVINLTFQFFFVYIWIWAAITVKEFTGFEWALMMQTMENAKGVVFFCPMLAIRAAFDRYDRYGLRST